MTTARVLPRALAALGAAVALLLCTGPAALAHGGEGQMEVTSITRDGDQVTVAVHLIAIDDGHGLPDATVTVVVGDATAVPMEPGAEDGDYQATVVAEAGAPIRITSVEPPTTAEATAPPMAEETTSTVATTAPETTEAPESTVETTPTTVAEEEAADPVADQEIDGGSDDSRMSWALIGGIAVLAVALVAVAIILFGRKGRPDADATDG